MGCNLRRLTDAIHEGHFTNRLRLVLESKREEIIESIRLDGKYTLDFDGVQYLIYGNLAPLNESK